MNYNNTPDKEEKYGPFTFRQIVIFLICLIILLIIFGYRILNSGILGGGGLDYTASSDLSDTENEEQIVTMYFVNDVQVADTMDLKDATWKEDFLYDDPISVIGQEGDYYLVRLDDGRGGYVSKDDLTLSKPKYVDEDDTHWEYDREGLSIEIDKYTDITDDGNVVYWVAQVNTSNPQKDINTAFASGSYDGSIEKKMRCSLIAQENNAIFAVNGDACGFRGYGDDYQDPILIRNGKIYYEDDRNIGAMCALYKSGKLKIFYPKELGSAEDMVSAGITDTWWFDTYLVNDYNINQALIDSEQSLKRAPYTAIGQIDKNHFIFICVDGRGSNDSIGVTYTGMAYLMKRYGCKTAYELDGGGSTTIYFDGMVLNKPSDGRQRAISDIVYVSK